jgi:tripartite-type tricarboxylate transporter receptor subunit TctC
MKPPRRELLPRATVRNLLALVSVLMLTLPSNSAWPQATRTIKVVVPFTPGGPSDTLTRVLADQIRRAQGATVVIENRPGASSVIGTEAVSRAVPDGSTVLIVSNSFVINPHLRKLSYDPLTSFEPICYLVRSPQVIVVNGGSPYRTIPDLRNAAQASPGSLTLASFGPASSTHIAFEMFKRAADVDMTFVPYPGMAPAVNALLGEHVTSAWVDYSAVAEQVKAGRLRVVAAAARTRIEALPDAPTLAEAGYADVEVDAGFGLVAPAKTPRDKVSDLAGWFTAALREPEIKARLTTLGLEPVGMCGAEFGALLRKQDEEYGRAIREANIRAE